MKRPLWTVGLCFSLGLLAAAMVELRLCMALGAVCGILAIFAVCLPNWRHTAAPAALFSAAAAFCIFTTQYVRLVLPAEAYADTEVAVTATVTEVDIPYLTAKVTDGDLPKGTRLVVHTQDADVAAGSTLTGRCYVQAIDSGFTRLITFDPLTVSAGEGLRYTLALWQQQLGQVYDTLGPETGSILWAMCLGDGRHLSVDTTAAFRMAGTAHLLVVSGLHVSIIAAAVLFLLRRLHRPHWLCPFLAIMAVLLYMGLTGFHYSVLRAGIMQLLFLLGTLLGREADGRNSLGGALLFILLFDTAAVYDVGLWMSATSTAVLLLLYPALRRWMMPKKWLHPSSLLQRLVRYGLDSLLVSLSAVVAITPVQLLIFRQFTWISPLTNLFAVPVSTPLVITGGLAALTGLSPALSFVTAPLLLLAQLLAWYLNAVSALFARVPYATLAVESPYLILWILGSMALIGLGWYFYKGHGLKAALLCSAVTLIAGVSIWTVAVYGVTTVQALPIGDGTALLATDANQAVLLFTGETKATARCAADQLAETGVKRLDWLILPHSVNNGVTVQVLSENGITVERVATTAPDGILPDTVPLTVWDSTLSLTDEWRAERLYTGWLRLFIGDTCCLITPPGGDAATLNGDWRSTHLLIYDREPPLHNTALIAQRAIVSCEPAFLSAVTKALPRGTYPLELLTDDAVLLRTRGRGDLSIPKEE